MLYVDRPDERPAAIWGVDIATGAKAPYSTVVGTLHYNDRFVIVRQSYTTQSVTVHDRETAESWDLYGVGSVPLISPDGSLIAYDGGSALQPINFNRRLAPIFLTALDGSNPRHLTTIYGAGIVGWFPDASRLLVQGTQNPDTERSALWHVDVTTGTIEKLDEAARIRNVSLSPDGAWVVFLTLFEKDPYWNTTWAMNVHTGEQRRLDFVGRYAWAGKEGATLVYVPPRDTPDQGFGVWKLNVASGSRTPLTNPAQTPLFIANGDWALAPDGKTPCFRLRQGLRNLAPRDWVRDVGQYEHAVGDRQTHAHTGALAGHSE